MDALEGPAAGGPSNTIKGSDLASAGQSAPTGSDDVPASDLDSATRLLDDEQHGNYTSTTVDTSGDNTRLSGPSAGPDGYPIKAAGRVPPLSPKMHNSLSGIALSNLAKNFTIGTPPHTPSQAPAQFGSSSLGDRGRCSSVPESLALSPGVMTTGHIAAVTGDGGFGGANGGAGASGNSFSVRRAEFSQSGSTLAPLGAPARRVDTDDELLQQQVLWEVDLSELDFGASKVLGRGAYGEVILAKWRSLPVAIKRVNVASKGAWKELRHEIAVIAQLHHPRVAQFLGACTRSQPWLIISEYMPGRALSSLLETRNGRPLPHHIAGRFVLDCAQGLRYLHEHKPLEIVHRDLKPNNLLIDGSGHVKIADFGLAKVLDVLKAQSDTYVMTGETGSYRYMAPEVFRHEKYSDKVDIYSLGMIAFQLFHGEAPFEGMPPLEAAKAAALKHLRPVISAKLDPKLRALITACWHPDPSRRPSAREVCTQLDDMFPQEDPQPEVLTDERCCSVQ